MYKIRVLFYTTTYIWVTKKVRVHCTILILGRDMFSQSIKYNILRHQNMCTENEPREKCKNIENCLVLKTKQT